MGTKAQLKAKVGRLVAVEDAFDALDDSVLSHEELGLSTRGAQIAEAALARFDTRLGAAATPVDISQVAEILGVTPPTVRDWLGRGILTRVYGVTPVAVTFQSVRWARSQLTELREQGSTRTYVHLLEAAARRDRVARVSPTRPF